MTFTSTHKSTQEKNTARRPSSAIQPSMKVNPPGDTYEKEAESVEQAVRGIPVSKSDSGSPSETHGNGPVSQANATHISRKPAFVKSLQRSQEDGNDGEFIPGAHSSTIQASGAEGGEVSPSVESAVNSGRGGGKPLADNSRKFMESYFQSDFGSVSVHDNAESARLNDEVGSKAFTHGNDIYFNENQYQPETPEGRGLLAHELTHVVQQNEGMSAKRIQRATPPPVTATSYSVSKGEYKGSELDVVAKRLKISRLSLPSFKKRNAKLFTAPFNLRLKKRGQTDQVPNWKAAVEGDIRHHLKGKLKQAEDRGGVNEEKVYFFKGRKTEFYLFGTETELAERTQIPFWDTNQKSRTFQVDHIVEDQLGGDDKAGNYELLDATANMSAGSKLGSHIRTRIVEAIEALRADNPGATNITKAKEPKKSSFNEIIFTAFDYNLKDISGEPDKFWSLDQVKKGLHFKDIRPLRGKELDKMGKESNPMIFASLSGGDKLKTPKKKPTANWLPRIDLIDWNFADNPDPGSIAGTLTLDVFNSKGKKFSVGNNSAGHQQWNLIKIGGVYGGAIDPGDVAGRIKNSLRLPGMSPIALHQVSLSAKKGLIAEGKVLPTIPFIKDADISISINGDEISLFKTFETGELAAPPPFKISDTNLTVAYSSTRGLGAEGNVNFEIPRIGKGYVKASKSQKEGFSLEGAFAIDNETFDPATVKVFYKDNQWGFEGSIGIKEGKIKGVKSAEITLGYLEKAFSVSGNVQLDIPKLKEGSISVAYSEETGLVLEGSFSLENDLPGLKSAQFKARLTEGEDKRLKVYAEGTIEPNIPGFQAPKITGVYDDGLFAFELEKAYQISILDGTLKVGLTNRPVNEEGKPEGAPGDELRFYGGASVSAIFADFLKGTVALEVTPAGEVIMSGGISIPDKVPIVDKKLTYGPEELLKFPTLEIPIFGIRVLGKGVGIFAEIGGGLSFEAGIGPLYLSELSLGLEGFNPLKADQAQVKGKAGLELPAYASLKMNLFAGVGVSLLIVEASGRLNGSASLIIRGDAGGSVTLLWNQRDGLQLVDAEAHLEATVKMLLELFLTAAVKLDLLIKTITVWSDRWDLASIEFGSGLKFGIRFPVELENGKFKEIDVDKIKKDRPNFDAGERKKIFTDAIDTAKNPPKPPPPSQEEAIKELRKRKPAGFWFNTRRWYVFELKGKYPESDWKFLEEERKRLDQEEVWKFKDKLDKMPDDTPLFIVRGAVYGLKDDFSDANFAPLRPALKRFGLDNIV